MSYLECEKNFERRMKDLKKREDLIKDVEVYRECIFKRFLASEEAEDFKNSDLGKLVYCPRLVPREAMTSGMKEILHLSWDKSQFPTENFYMIDVNMCYSYIIKNFRYDQNIYHRKREGTL